MPSSRQSSSTIWKPVAIILAILLALMLAFAGLVVAGLVNLGFSLM